jgi:hypothetical protein
VHGRGIAEPSGPAHLVLEGPGIDRLRIQPQSVPRRGSDQDTCARPGRAARLQRPAQVRNVRLHSGQRPGRGLAGVQILDEPVSGHHPAMRCDQPRQHTAPPRAADTDWSAVDGDLERP